MCTLSVFGLKPQPAMLQFMTATHGFVAEVVRRPEHFQVINRLRRNCDGDAHQQRGKLWAYGREPNNLSVSYVIGILT